MLKSRNFTTYEPGTAGEMRIAATHTLAATNGCEDAERPLFQKLLAAAQKIEEAGPYPVPPSGNGVTLRDDRGAIARELAKTGMRLVDAEMLMQEAIFRAEESARILHAILLDGEGE